MMSEDERLSAEEVRQAFKYLLVCKLQRQQLPPPLPVVEQPATRYRGLRSHSPEPTVSRSPEKHTHSMNEPKLSGSAGDVASPQSFRLSRSATRSERFTLQGKLHCDPYSDSPFEYELIEQAFTRLYGRLQDSDGVRLSESGGMEVHIDNVKQYFLECYVNSQTFLHALIAPFKAAHWVDVTMFAAAVECVQQVSFDHAFFNKEELAATRNNLIRQKLLCTSYSVFFKIIDSNQKNALSRFEVKTVSAMALRSNKKVTSESLDMVVDKAFVKANESRGAPSDFISFEEFHAVLKN